MIHPIISQMGKRGLERERLVQGHPETWIKLGREVLAPLAVAAFPRPAPSFTPDGRVDLPWCLRARRLGGWTGALGSSPLPRLERQRWRSGSPSVGKSLEQSIRSLQKGQQGSPPLLLRILGAPRLGEPGGPFQTPNPSGDHFQAFLVNPWDSVPLEMQSMGRQELSRIQGMRITLSFSSCSPGV